MKTTMILLFIWVVAGIYFYSPTDTAWAEDVPKLRQGMWEFNRTIENPNDAGKPQTMVINKCTNPSEDMKRQKELASKIGCKISPMTKSGNTYSFISDCNIQNANIQTKSVITVENDSAYSVNVEVKSDAKSTKEVLKARRTGDCTK